MSINTTEGLRAACDVSLQRHREEPVNKQWHADVVDFIAWVRSVGPAERGSKVFQKRLWDENPVAATGQGQISIASAIEDASFRDLVGSLFDAVPAESQAQRTERIRGLFDRVVDALKPFVLKTELAPEIWTARISVTSLLR